MTGFGELSAFIGSGIVNLIFGSPLLAGIFVILFMLIVFWVFGITKDGTVVVIIPLILLFGTYGFIPQATVIIAWLIIGIMAFLIFIKLME